MPTAQEQFWAGPFGDSYGKRNRLDWRSRVPFWQDILDRTKARSVLEVGCNIGSNLKAIRQVGPTIAAWGCDINQSAIEEASASGLTVYYGSILDIDAHSPFGYLGLAARPRFDLVFTCGVLIHIAHEDLDRAMDEIITSSKRYVLAVEYAAEEEEEISYRGHAERLWKRPFGKLYQDKGLKLVAEFEAPSPAFDRCTAWLLERA